LQKHEWKPGIVIENNNSIHVIGDFGYTSNLWGGIECYDIRENKWFFVDELTTLLYVDK